MQRNSKNKLQVWIDDDLSHKIAIDCQSLSYRNKSDYVRDRLQAKSTYLNLHKEVILQMKKQGNNINQIAKHLNSFGLVESCELKNALDKITKSNFELLELLKGLDVSQDYK